MHSTTTQRRTLRGIETAAAVAMFVLGSGAGSSIEAGRERETRLEIEHDDARARTVAALAEILEIRRSARGLIVNLPDLLFKSDKAILEPNAVEVLSRVAGILQLVPEFEIQVEGHTDNVGVTEYNTYLSNGRAKVVRDYLVSAGISETRVTAAGFGETQPVAGNDTREGREKNRRVELIIIDRPIGRPSALATAEQ
jgi:outer membrane protein OmpA-like peptidoglycan-associated protein